MSIFIRRRRTHPSGFLGFLACWILYRVLFTGIVSMKGGSCQKYNYTILRHHRAVCSHHFATLSYQRVMSCFTGLTFYIFGLQYHLFYAINGSPMTWSKSVSFHSFICSCHWAMSRSAESRCTWTTINDITWRSNRFSVKVAFKMDALKLYGKRFLVDVLSQLESYNVRYNQFNNTTFRLDWFLGVLDRFSPTNLEDKVIIDRLIAQLQQVKAIVVQLDNDIFMGYCPQKIYSLSPEEGQVLIFPRSKSSFFWSTTFCFHK